MFKKLRNLTKTKLIGNILYRLVRGYCATFRLKIVNEKPWLDYMEKGGRVLICAWHQQFFSAIRYFKKYEKYHPSLMISKSLDGEIIAGVANRTGWYSVRGSSSHGGSIALKEMTMRLREYRLAAHILDGPRGPAGVVKPGIISMALAADAVIVPVHIYGENVWYFKSWDKFMLPRPFSRVCMEFGEMINLQPVQRETDFEEQRMMLETIMRPYLKSMTLADKKRGEI
jgi:lysophospholipid acyltransferase (LPLAT)-like uncharacterized protein